MAHRSRRIAGLGALDRTGRAALAALLALVLAAPALQAQEAAPQEPDTSAEQAGEAETAVPPIPDPPRFISGLTEIFEDISGDLFFWGQGATFRGTMGHNVFAGGQSVLVEDGSTVGGDLFGFAGDVSIDGEVMHDAYIWAGTARIGRDAVVHGNVLCFCGTLRIDGTVKGLVKGGGGNTAITGDVGSVKVEAGILTVGPEAVIRGDLEYEANDEADISETADIRGEVRRTIAADDEDDEEQEDSGGISAWSVGWRLWGYLSRLLVGVAFLLLGGAAARRPAARLRETPAVGLGFGFVVAVVFPVACVVAIGLIVSLPLGVIGLLLFAIAVFLSSLITSQYLGDWLLRRLRGGVEPSEYLALAVGLLVLTVLVAIPYLGFLIRLTAWLLGLGGMFLALRPAVRAATGDESPATVAP